MASEYGDSDVKEQVQSPKMMSLRVIVLLFGSVTVFLLLLACVLVGALFEEVERLAPKHDPIPPAPIHLVRGAVKSHLQVYNEWYLPTFPRGSCISQNKNLYSYQVVDDQQNSRTLSDWNNKVLLITNVAGFDSLTVSNYQGLNKLMGIFNNDTYSKLGRGFSVLAFPSNQFSNQAGPTTAELIQSLKHVRPGNDFAPTFPHFMTIDVNGLGTSPLYQYLRTSCTNPSSEIVANKHDLLWSSVTQSDISGNFEKFLVDANGVVRYRYPNKFSPLDLQKDIHELMLE